MMWTGKAPFRHGQAFTGLCKLWRTALATAQMELSIWPLGAGTQTDRLIYPLFCFARISLLLGETLGGQHLVCVFHPVVEAAAFALTKLSPVVTLQIARCGRGREDALCRLPTPRGTGFPTVCSRTRVVLGGALFFGDGSCKRHARGCLGA